MTHNAPLIQALQDYYHSRKENLFSLRTFIGAHEVVLNHTEKFDSFKWFMANHFIPKEMSIYSFFHLVSDHKEARAYLKRVGFDENVMVRIGEIANIIIQETIARRNEPVTMENYQDLSMYNEDEVFFMNFRYNFTYTWHLAHAIIRREFARIRNQDEGASDEEIMRRVFDLLKEIPEYDQTIYRPITTKVQIYVPNSSIVGSKLSFYEALSLLEKQPNREELSLVTDLKDYGLFAIVNPRASSIGEKDLQIFNLLGERP